MHELGRRAVLSLGVSYDQRMDDAYELQDLPTDLVLRDVVARVLVRLRIRTVGGKLGSKL